MQLRAVVSASPCDEERDDLAFVYAHDKAQKYSVSLARQPDSDLVELMVGDQLNAKVTDLAVTLTDHDLIVEVPPEVASELDGTARYEVELINGAEAAAHLSAALKAIFLGKQGLTVVATLGCATPGNSQGQQATPPGEA